MHRLSKVRIVWSVGAVIAIVCLLMFSRSRMLQKDESVIESAAKQFMADVGKKSRIPGVRIASQRYGAGTVLAFDDFSSMRKDRLTAIAFTELEQVQEMRKFLPRKDGGDFQEQVFGYSAADQSALGLLVARGEVAEAVVFPQPFVIDN